MEVLKIFVEGVVAIGVITALFSKGRQTTQFAGTVFNGAGNLLHRAEVG